MTETGLKKVTLALQGGGSHGTFTWGVLEELLEDGRLQIEGISDTSAGAMNGAVLAHGLDKEGPEGAKSALKNFWFCISSYGSFSPYHSGPFNPWGADWSPTALWFDFIAQLYSPYQLNPFNFNPLRAVAGPIVALAFVATLGSVFGSF
ncbi:MAG: patatin-like phospholipase family protein [Desulfovermiculus sp.]|nr:patatin-like phospholipase family protein [Desulfovermiculus sp.]